MSKSPFDGYRPWDKRREIINGDDSYFEETTGDDDADIVLHEVVSSRIVALSSLITSMKDIQGMEDETRKLCLEAMKLAVESEDKSGESVDHEPADGA